MSIRRAAAAIAGCLILSHAAAAQQPGVSAGRLAPPDEAARATFEKALLEVENVTPTRAEPLLQELLQARPDHGLLRALHAFSDPNMLTAERLGEMNRAVEDAAKGGAAELVLATAMRERVAGRTTAALTLLDAAAKLLPGESLVDFLRIQYTMSDPALGLRNAEAGHARFPKNPGIMNLLAYQRYESGFKKDGIDLAREYVQVLPDHPNAHDTYAELLQREGDLAAAGQEYRRALEVDPMFYAARYGLAELALSRGDMRSARAEIETALQCATGRLESLDVLETAAFAAALDRDVPAMRGYMHRVIAGWQAAGATTYVRDRTWYLAMMEAAAGNRAEAEAALAKVGTYTPANTYMGLGTVALYAFLGDRAQLDAGVAEMERSAAEHGNTGYYPEAAHLARTIRAAAIGDVATAQQEFAGVKYDGYRAIGNGHLARALDRARDRAGAAKARAELEGYNQFDWYRTMGLLAAR